MNKTIKWMLVIIAGLGGLFVITLVSLPFIIDPNDYKDKISTIVHDQTGRVLSIPGDIKLQVSPRLDLAFSLGEIRLAAGKDFPDTPFASSKLAEIKLALWPLLTKKQLQINTIDLSGVQLNLIRNMDGKTNWEDLAGGKTTKPDQAPKSAQKTSTQPSKKGLPTIDIGGINISDINVQYQDKQSNKTISLNNFNLNVGHLQENIPFPVTADFTFILDDNKQPLTATLKTSFELTLNLSGQHFLINGFNLNGLLQGAMFPSSKLELTLMADADINILDEKVIVKKFMVKQGDLTAETALTLTGFKAPAIEGTFTLAEYSPKEHLAQLGLSLPHFSDPKALDLLSAALGFSLDNDRFEIKEMQVKLDDTTIEANASVHNLQQPAYALNLHIDQLDLDRYAVKKTPDAKQKAPTVPEETAQTTGETQLIIPVHLLRDLTFNADIKVDALKAAKLHMSDITLKTDGKDGLIQLQPLSANLYEGSLTVTGAIDARKDVPEMRLKKTLQGVQLGPLFVDMIGKEEISGRADIEADVVTRGLDKDALTRNANGTVKLSLANGRIAKLQILQTIRLAKALLDNKAPAPSSTEQPTGFASLTASGTLTNGVFKNSDLLAASDLMKITGKGSVDLVREEVDYLLTIYLTDRIEREQETGLVELGNMPIPYRIQGSFTELQQSAAMEELVKAKAKEVLFEALEKQLDTGTDEKGKPATDAGSLINQGLKSLFGN